MVTCKESEARAGLGAVQTQWWLEMEKAGFL